MIDSERFKLLYGPYLPPKCRVGDKLPEEQWQHACREGVQRPAVADATGPGEPPHEGDHVVRGRPGWLFEDENSIHRRRTRPSATDLCGDPTRLS